MFSRKMRSILLLGLVAVLAIIGVSEVTGQSTQGAMLVPGSVTCDTSETWHINGISVYPDYPLAQYWRRWSYSNPIIPVGPFAIDPIRVNNSQAEFTYQIPLNWYSSQNGGWVAGTQPSVTVKRPACADPALTPNPSCGPRACRPSIEPPVLRGGLVKEVQPQIKRK